MSNTKFKFVENKANDFLIEDQPEPDFKEEVKKEIENEKTRKKRKRKLYLVTALVMMGINILLVGFGLLWQWEISLMAFGDALWLAFAIELTVAWVMFVYNHNILSPFIHGVKTFGLMIVGKRPKLDYYHYMKKVEDDQIPKFYYIVVFLSTLFLLILALITLFMLI
ncbi:MAG: hypothetical protein V3569_05635 [Acholeplasmataceae bacterium]